MALENNQINVKKKKDLELEKKAYPQ